MANLEKDDIQALVFNGYPKNTSAAFVLLEVIDPAKSREWLRKVAGSLATGEKREYGTTLNLALTARGLSALGLPDECLRSFSREFHEGMAGEDHRSRILGDVDESSPTEWVWGGPDTPRRRPVHAMLMVYAAGDDALRKALAACRIEYEGALRETFLRDTVWLPNRQEHFGFADGIAQPAMEGTRHAGENGIRAGEFVFGYPNQYGKLPISPIVPARFDRGRHLKELPAAGDVRDFGRNGTYLVVRQLEQHVQEFWEAMQEYGKRPDGVIDREQAVRLASKCVGRWPSGAPLVKSAERDDPTLADDDFMYAAADRDGLKCPVGAHIRRTNPRDSLEPSPEESLQVVDRHRILRRGRSYGSHLEKFSTESQKTERGLFFICINANIRRQFEFIQQTWCNNGKFDGLYEDKDPLIGDQPKDKGGTFTIPEAPVRRRLGNIARFVRVAGGEYFFLPSVRAVRFLGDLEG